MGKQTSIRNILSCFLVVVMLVCMLPGTAFAADGDIILYHTNDIHGAVDGWLEYLKTVKDSTPNSLLLDAGDATQGVAIATYSKGEAIIRLMNAAGYDGMVLGNHEFDYYDAGTQTNFARHNSEVAEFPMLSANTLHGDKAYLAGVNEAKDLAGYETANEAYFIKEVNGKRLGVFGITTLETAYKTAPANLPGITFGDEIVYSKMAVEALEAEEVDYIIGLMHVGTDMTSKPTTVDIANAVDGIDIIIDGHSHQQVQRVVNGTYICQTGSGSSPMLGEIVISANGSISSRLISKATITKNYAPDQGVKALYNEYYEKIQEELSRVVGYTETGLYGGTYNSKSVNRLVNTNLGNLIGDGMVDYARTLAAANGYAGAPVVAMQNGGGIRDSIMPGLVTMEDIVTVLPFGNSVSVKMITPDVLYSVLEFGISGCKTLLGNLSSATAALPNVGGMRFEYTIKSGSTANTVDAVYLLHADGSETLLDRMDTETEIIFASNDFLVGGGDGYEMLMGIKHIAEGGALDLIMGDYIERLTLEQGGTFYYPSGLNRVTTSSITPASYNYTLTVKQGGSAIANAEVVLVPVDLYASELDAEHDFAYTVRQAAECSEYAVKTTTNAKGQATINLPAGQHDVAVIYDGKVGTALADKSMNMTSGTADLTAGLYYCDGLTAEAINLELAKLYEEIETLTLADQSAIAALRARYQSLPEAVQPLVTNLSYLGLLEARMELIGDDRYLAAKAVEAQIAAIKLEEISMDDKAIIDGLIRAYDLLHADFKQYVSNYETLSKAAGRIDTLFIAHAQEINAEISALSERIERLTLEDESAVIAVKAAYEALPAEYKLLVTNADEITALEARLTLLKDPYYQTAKALEAQIAVLDLTQITMADKAYVDGLTAAYEDLPPTYRTYVENHAQLLEAVRVLDELFTEQVRQLSARLSELSKDLLQLTLADEAEIKALRAAYDALPAEYQAKVEDAKALADLERQMALLKDEMYLAARDLAEKINQIDVDALTEEDKKFVDELLAEYNALPEAYQGYVLNADLLYKAADRIHALHLDIVADLMERIDKLAGKLDAVTLSDEAEILALRAVYDGLPAEYQAMVTNLVKLSLLEKRLEELKQDPTKPTEPTKPSDSDTTEKPDDSKGRPGGAKTGDPFSYAVAGAVIAAMAGILLARRKKSKA